MTKQYRNIILIIITFLFFGCEKTIQEESSAKKTVSLSTFVLYDIAQHIAEDTLNLVKIIPSGVDLHSYEPTPQTMAQVEKSALVIYNGVGLEPWLSTFNFENKKVPIGRYIKLRSLAKKKCDSHAHHAHSCSHGDLDPHFWLDIENMKRAADIITYEFITLLPKNKKLYLNNRDKYFVMLEKVDRLYKENLHSCKNDTIITNHNAFSYLSQKYNFKVKSLSGLSPDSEPSPKDVIRVIKDIQSHNVSVVFFENFANSKSMKSIATQAEVKLDSLHPIGNSTKEDTRKKHTYEIIMLNNLEKIREALICQ